MKADIEAKPVKEADKSEEDWCEITNRQDGLFHHKPSLTRFSEWYQTIELFKVGGSSAMQLSNQSDTPEVLYNLFLRIKTGVPL